MKFKRLEIQNFQSHVDTVIDFSADFNVIIGPSDTGKSAIIRALRKLVRDDPSGKGFLHNGKSECIIKLTVEKNGSLFDIIRKITPSKNLYYIGENEFGGFGREIPEEVQGVLEMTLIELENGSKIDLHFVDQFDAPFMVSRGAAGERSKLFGYIGGLHVLDRAITQVNSDIRRGNTELKSQASIKTGLQQKIECFQDLTVAKTRLNELNALITSAQNRARVLSNLQNTQQQLQEIVAQGKYLRSRNLPKLQIDFNVFRLKQRSIRELVTIQQQLQNVEKQITQISNTAIPSINVDFDRVTEHSKYLNKLKQCYVQYDTISHAILDAERRQQEYAQLDIELTQQLKNVLHELKICPVCKQSTANIK